MQHFHSLKTYKPKLLNPNSGLVPELDVPPDRVKHLLVEAVLLGASQHGPNG